MTFRDIRSIQRILALSVETLLRNGHETECDEAIRQGRKVAADLGPYADDGCEIDEARAIETRNRTLAAAGILDGPNVIKLPARPRQ